MCAITRASRMVPRSCCRTSSGKTRTLVAWCMELQAFRSARRSCSKSFSRWRLERGPGAFDFLSDGPGRVHLRMKGYVAARAWSAVGEPVRRFRGFAFHQELVGPALDFAVRDAHALMLAQVLDP